MWGLQLRANGQWYGTEANDRAYCVIPWEHGTAVTGAAFRKINKLADAGHEGARRLASYYVGQGVGLMNHPLATRTVVYEFMEDFAAAAERLALALTDEA